MDGRTWLDDVLALFRHKALSERAAAQVSDDGFFEPFGRSPHSIAILMKHVGGQPPLGR